MSRDVSLVCSVVGGVWVLVWLGRLCRCVGERLSNGEMLGFSEADGLVILEHIVFENYSLGYYGLLKSVL